MRLNAYLNAGLKGKFGETGKNLEFTGQAGNIEYNPVDQN